MLPIQRVAMLIVVLYIPPIANAREVCSKLYRVTYRQHILMDEDLLPMVALISLLPGLTLLIWNIKRMWQSIQTIKDYNAIPLVYNGDTLLLDALNNCCTCTCMSCLNDYWPVALTTIIMNCFNWLVIKCLKSSFSTTLEPSQYTYHPNWLTEDAIVLPSTFLWPIWAKRTGSFCKDAVPGLYFNIYKIIPHPY